MKKQFYLLFAILVAFSSLFVSCDENGLDSDPTICKITLMKDGDGTVSFTDYIGMSVNVLIGDQVEVVATPDKDCDFIGWFVGDSETAVCTDAEYTFTVPEEDLTLIAKFSKRPVVTIRSAGNGSVSFKDSADDTLAFLPGSEVTVVATPDKDCDFIGWFVGDDATPVSTEAAYTFVVSRSVVLVAKFWFPYAATGSVDGHEFVDLGLPSGLKWATCNVGATEIYGNGEHYAWGETEVKSDYTTWENYWWCDGTDEYMTKYNGHDGNKILGLSNDAAYCKWGASWRMPTQAEMQELCDNCTFESVKVEGVLGIKVKGPNGRCIFLPAASYKGSTGNVWLGWFCYWSSSVSTDGYIDACCLSFNIYGTGGIYNPKIQTKLRRLGYSIRPVVR